MIGKRALLLVAFLGAGALLAGCGGTRPSLVTQELTAAEWEALSPKAKIFAIEGDRTVILTAIAPYLDQPWCTETLIIACKDRAVIEPLRALDTELEETVNLARDRGGDVRTALIVKARQLLARLVIKAAAAGFGR